MYICINIQSETCIMKLYLKNVNKVMGKKNTFLPVIFVDITVFSLYKLRISDS